MISLFLALIDEEEDKEFFKRIYNEYEKPMWYTAKKYIKNDTLSNDAVQNAFLGVARNIKTIKNLSEGQIHNYLLVAAKNAALDLQKKEKKFEHADIDALYDLSDDKTSGDIEALEEKTYVASVIERVSPAYRDAMYMSYVLGLSAMEIGKVLGITANNVRQRLLRGRQQFIKIYSSEMKLNGKK